MGNLNRVLIAAVLVVTAGCASEKKDAAPAAAAPVAECSRCEPTDDPTEDTTVAPDAPTGTGVTPEETGYDSGSTAAITLDGGTSKLRQMFFRSNPNNPTNVRINLDLNRPSQSVIVSYIDNGKLVEAKLGTTHPYNGSISDKSLNGWVTQDGKTIWKGFFQDDAGAVVIIVDRFLSQGDGQSGNIMGGSIWFQNFNQYNPNNPINPPVQMCWNVKYGPYDCRTFLVGDIGSCVLSNAEKPKSSINMTSSYYPNNRGPCRTNEYLKLGDFDGVSKSTAGF